MTEPQAGSDTSAIRTTAVLDPDTKEWVLNGEKIFVTAGHKSLLDSEGLVVVWATIDPSAGRAGMRPFVVEAGNPGAKVTKLEHKLGIRASDTASIVLQECRVPFENILGSPEVAARPTTTKGFKGAMATFDATRPLVAATGIGVARAALELLKELLEQQGITIRYGLPRQKMTNIEREVIDMEIMLQSAWLLVIKAVWMADNRLPNPMEASMSKVRAGDVVTKITQTRSRDHGTGRLQPRPSAGKMVPGCQDHRYLRGHRADQPADCRPEYPLLQRARPALSSAAY